MCSDAAKRTLLIVDDDAAIRESLAELLEDEGYLVVTAINGEDALAKLRNGLLHPCLILLDLMMPVMSGPEFWEAMRSDPQLADIPVVIISADGNVRQKAAALGGAYLLKPMKITTMIDTIERYCVPRSPGPGAG